MACRQRSRAALRALSVVAAKLLRLDAELSRSSSRSGRRTAARDSPSTTSSSSPYLHSTAFDSWALLWSHALYIILCQPLYT